MPNVVVPSRGSRASRENRPQSSSPTRSCAAGDMMAPSSMKSSSGQGIRTMLPSSMMGFVGRPRTYTVFLADCERMRAPGRGTITCTRPCTLERLVPTDSRHALIRRRVQYLRGATTDVSRPCRSAVSVRPELRQMRRMCRAVSLSNVILILASSDDGLPALLGVFATRRRVPRGYAISRPTPAFESEHDFNWRPPIFIKAQLDSVRAPRRLKTCSLFWCQIGASVFETSGPKLSVGMRKNATEVYPRGFSCKKPVRT